MRFVEKQKSTAEEFDIQTEKKSFFLKKKKRFLIDQEEKNVEIQRDHKKKRKKYVGRSINQPYIQII